MQFLGKNVATGVYIDLQLWAQCLRARAWISMATVTRRMQTQRFLVQERPASYQTTGSARSTVQVSTYQKFAWETLGMMRRLGSDSFKLFSAILVRDRSPQKKTRGGLPRAPRTCHRR